MIINTSQYDTRHTHRHINTSQYDARYTQRHINTLQYDARYTQRHIHTLQYDVRCTQCHINTLQYDVRNTQSQTYFNFINGYQREEGAFCIHPCGEYGDRTFSRNVCHIQLRGGIMRQ